MKQRLDRKPLFVKVADALEEAMRKGDWKEGLPGYRVIAKDFEVSWRTSQQALKVLASRGLIGPARKGRPRRVLQEGVTDSMTRKVMLVITSSKTPADAGEQALLDDLIMIWMAHGGYVRRAQIDYRQRKQPDTALRKLLSDHAASVLMMREPRRPWVAAAMRLPEPVFFLGGDIPRDDFEKVSGFAVSISEMVSQAVARLRGLGHQRILMPDEGRGPMFRQGVLAAMRRSWGEGARQPDAELCCPEFAELEPEAWQRYWQDSFRRARPTAVIVHKETSYFSLLGFCFRRKLRIPEDLSVICLAASDSLLWCHPVPDHVTFPKAKALADFRRWLNGGLQTTGLVLLPVDSVNVGSVRAV
jgi:DNA-binding LacI/PurR family transcriptional regulator